MAQQSKDETLSLAQYAERAYLEYAMSVVRSRALPDVSDGQKPVQRRILYAMHDMHLASGAKPVKSARVVGEILGKYHPHGDSSAYEAMVRMAQDFTLRYPLIDGVGNFGSRDGDGAAAMRYTEARLTPFSELLLSEIDSGTVDFIANYDGAFTEPAVLPARLPMVLLNGASGIAVGMATEIPSHNLNEVAAAAAALLQNPHLSNLDLMTYLPAPDFAGGAQIISNSSEIAKIYETGRGSLRVRARYRIEKLARGQWRAVVFELPPGVSTKKVLDRIEEISNPKVKSGKKQLTQDQQNLKTLMLSQLDRVRDESDAREPIRLVFEPKSSRQDPDEWMMLLMAQTDLEINVPINLVMMGLNGSPAQKNLKAILSEWLDFRVNTVTRRLSFRLDQVQKRIHIVQGRMTAFLHIDEVIAIIRQSDDPKSDLIKRFGLSEIQADDILEIRLRQLARLEWIKLEKEFNTLQNEEAQLQHLLSDENAKKRMIIKEIKSDAQTYGDHRRTLVEVADRAVINQALPDENITILLSQNGWIRTRSGHQIDKTQISFKEGDSLAFSTEMRTIQMLVLIDSQGRSYSLDVSEIPGGRGDGVPITSLIDLPTCAQIVGLLSGNPEDSYLLSGSGGYGFIARLGDMATRQKSGKLLITLDHNETALRPQRLPADSQDHEIIVASDEPRLLAFELSQLRHLAKGRGLQLIKLNNDHQMRFIAIGRGSHFKVMIEGRRGALRTEKLPVEIIRNKRASKGKPMSILGQIKSITWAHTDE